MDTVHGVGEVKDLLLFSSRQSATKWISNRKACLGKLLEH